MDCSPPGSSVHGILQARTLEWTAVEDPPPGDLPDPGIKPTSLTSSVLVGSFFTTSATWEAHTQGNIMVVNFFYSRILVVQENEYIPWLSTEESSFRDLNFALSISTNIASYHISISLKIELMFFCFKVVNGAHRDNIPFSEITMYERQNSLHFCVCLHFCICTCTYLIKTKWKGKPAAESKF